MLLYLVGVIKLLPVDKYSMRRRILLFKKIVIDKHMDIYNWISFKHSRIIDIQNCHLDNSFNDLGGCRYTQTFAIILS